MITTKLQRIKYMLDGFESRKQQMRALSLDCNTNHKLQRRSNLLHGYAKIK